MTEEIHKTVGTEPKFYIWEGVFENFVSAQKIHKGEGFSSSRYLKQALNAAQESIKALNKKEQIPLFHKQRFTLFPITVSLMLCELLNSKLRVLDFGGGLGIGYMSCVESIPDAQDLIDYTVVELSEICKVGVDFAKSNDLPVAFMNELSPQNEYDLVFCSSALQYIEDWKNLIKNFIQTKPSKILLSDIFCGKFNSFTTLQNYYESKIPHWFFSESELINEFEKNNYELILKTSATGRRAGIDDFIPMSNFPESLQIKTTSHLLFSRKVKTTK